MKLVQQPGRPSQSSHSKRSCTTLKSDLPILIRHCSLSSRSFRSSTLVIGVLELSNPSKLHRRVTEERPIISFRVNLIDRIIAW